MEEITYEVDPATIDQSQLDRMIESGVQRFSVGLQSLNAQHLARIGRRHTPADGHQLLGWLRERRATFSVDVLFSLPEQKTEDLDADLAQILGYEPDHVSPYYLTLKSTHPLNRGRPSEDQDVDLMDLVESRLLAAGYLRYEISNYAKPGKEARHNRLYWTDQAYLGLGMSAHSYDPRRGPWGTRWSNDKTMVGYQSQVDNSRTHSLIEELQWEEALTDFCHTSFRRCEGLIWAEVETKFGSLGPRSPVPKIREVAAQVAERGLVQVDSMGARLTAAGRKLVDPVLLEFTFLPAR